MLPTVVLFRDGIAVDRIVGFEALGGSDDFATKDLEEVSSSVNKYTLTI